MAKRIRILVLITGLNFWAGIGEYILLHGDGLSGYAAAGHYFVAMHGQFTEVPGIVWYWSRYHTLSVFVLIFLTIAVKIYTSFAKDRPKQP